MAKVLLFMALCAAAVYATPTYEGAPVDRILSQISDAVELIKSFRESGANSTRRALTDAVDRESCSALNHQMQQLDDECPAFAKLLASPGHFFSKQICASNGCVAKGFGWYTDKLRMNTISHCTGTQPKVMQQLFKFAQKSVDVACSHKKGGSFCLNLASSVNFLVSKVGPQPEPLQYFDWADPTPGSFEDGTVLESYSVRTEDECSTLCNHGRVEAYTFWESKFFEWGTNCFCKIDGVFNEHPLAQSRCRTYNCLQSVRSPESGPAKKFPKCLAKNHLQPWIDHACCARDFLQVVGISKHDIADRYIPYLHHCGAPTSQPSCVHAADPAP